MKLFINQCRYQDLFFFLFGVGRRVVDRIWEILIIKGFIVEDDLVIIFYFRIIRVLLDFIDFFLLFDEIMNENFGCDKGEGSRVYQEYYERVKSLDNLWFFKGRGFECDNKLYLRGLDFYCL